MRAVQQAAQFLRDTVEELRIVRTRVANSAVVELAAAFATQTPAKMMEAEVRRRDRRTIAMDRAIGAKAETRAILFARKRCARRTPGYRKCRPR